MRAAELLEQAEALLEGVTEGPWSWMDCGEKDNSWALGLAIDPVTEKPLTDNIHDWEAEQFDSGNEEAQAVVVECVAENFGSNANLADAAFIAAARSLVPALAARLRDALTVIDVQADVREFHDALGMPNGDTPAIRRPDLRSNLIEEEAAETVEAIRAGDLVAAIDGLCDLLCVVYGTALEFGIDIYPFWAEVHRTNMAKASGSIRADGKALKPDGWQPPDIAGVLAAVFDAGPAAAEEEKP